MTSPDVHIGLTSAQVEENRKKYGVNILTPPPSEPLWHKFIGKFKDPLIIILLIAGILSIGISYWEYYSGESGIGTFAEPLGIFIAIFLATGLAFYFEEKAGREFDLLNQLNDDEPVQVVRNGKVTQVPKKDIVVGDIVILNTGNDIPADGTLIEAISLNVDESSLTGEPSCVKTADPRYFDTEATFASNAVMRGSRVMEGHGVMLVTAVGDKTENGKVFTASQIDNSVKMPLDEQLERLGGMISKVSYVLAALIISGRIGIFLIANGFEWIAFLSVLLKSVMIAVALIVVSVPEGLPMAVTLSLATSMRRMLKSNNLVRKLHACETMGAATVICTDKTGTLTENRMRIVSTDFFIPESDSCYIYEGMAVNSTAELDRDGNGEPKVLGNPTEGALLLWLDAQGINYNRLRSENSAIEELPFSADRKYMATKVRRTDGTEVLYIKGAPEIVFNLCRNFQEGVTTDSINALLLGYQSRAMRTIGFAYQIIKPGDKAITDKRVTAENLTFVGIAAISDPVRETVPGAVKDVLDAGINIKIVTGDTPATAKEIGRQIGLWNDDTDGNAGIITGEEFAAIPDAILRERVADLKIIARARPMDKKRLVEALQSRGEIVAVTGDGTNDAPALKAAHVGLSMGGGTSVAKEASDITIIDNSFASIGRAVMWGRSLYLNIQRFILFQMTVNVVACLIVLCGAFMGVQSPLTVTQMLWVNLIMDTFAAMALASLPPSAQVMKHKPRSRSAFIINAPMWRSIIGIGLLFFAILMAILLYFEHTDVTSLCSALTAPRVSFHGLTAYELSIFFTIFVFLQFWNMFNARAFATGRSALRLKGCTGFGLIAMMIVGGQVLIVNVGGTLFSVTPIKLADWAIIIASTSVVLWAGELYRLIFNRSNK